MCDLVVLPSGDIRDRIPYVINFAWNPYSGFSCSDDLETTIIPEPPKAEESTNSDFGSPSFASANFGGGLKISPKFPDVLFELKTATSFKCTGMWLSKEFEYPVQIQLKVGVKNCARLLFIKSEIQALTEDLNPLQKFKFYFPSEIPESEFKFKLVGTLMMPVP